MKLKVQTIMTARMGCDDWAHD